MCFHHCKKTRLKPTEMNRFQGLQGLWNLSSLKSLKIQKPSPIPAISLLQPSEMDSLSNSRWQNCKDRPSQSTNNGYMFEKAS